MPLSKQTGAVTELIDKLLEFLQPFMGLANCHMVDFFTKSAYNCHVPKTMQDEIDQIGKSSTINCLLNNNLDNMQFLKQYVDRTDEFTLKNSSICLSADSFGNKMKQWGCPDFDQFKLEIFMTPKKSHEVEIMSSIASALFKLSGASHVVDVGDGKGYLSSFLALHHKIPVLGIDASDINTNGAVKRAKKLSRVWKGVRDAPRKSYPAKHDNTASADVNLYQQVTCFVDESFDFHELITGTFLTDGAVLGLVGLHTCGNLAANCLRIFSSNSSIKTVCNVGCCYHLLSELDDCSNRGFPMSNFLISRKLVIGRSARMIASQSVDRVLHDKQLPNKAIYYRALLQVVLETYCEELPSGHVGRFKKPCTSFVEYCRKSLQRLGVHVEVTDDELDQMDKYYECRLDELNVFYLLRCKLSPVIESLILLDRLLFLYESGYENSYLVQMFDPVISPRCYGVVAFKESPILSC